MHRINIAVFLTLSPLTFFALFIIDFLIDDEIFMPLRSPFFYFKLVCPYGVKIIKMVIW